MCVQFCSGQNCVPDKIVFGLSLCFVTVHKIVGNDFGRRLCADPEGANPRDGVS